MPKSRGNVMRQIIGIDEVGMGPLAGPVVAAAVLIEDKLIDGVRDSKLVDETLRYELADSIRSKAQWTAIGERHAESINATRVRTCWAQIIVELANAAHEKFPEAEILMDGAFDRRVHEKVPFLKFVVNGDDNVYQIAAASLVANFPDYHWRSNKGYGTPHHIETIRRLGLTPLHRIKQVEKVLRFKSGSSRPQTVAEEVAEYPYDVARRYVDSILSYDLLSDFEKKFTANMRDKIDRSESLSPRMKYFLKQIAGRVEKRRRKTQGAP
jgi:ribonuclease HII